MQWSAVRQNRQAVVGYNIGLFSFFNHPLSGFSSIGNISCANENGRRQKRQSSDRLGSEVTRVGQDPIMKTRFRNCLRSENNDKERFGNKTPSDLASLLKPCPCTRDQATNDGRFIIFSQSPLCYVSTVPTPSTLNDETISLTQQCCYNTDGYVKII